MNFVMTTPTFEKEGKRITGGEKNKFRNRAGGGVGNMLLAGPCQDEAGT